MKKTAFFLTALLIAALLCGCGAASAPSEDENALHCTVSVSCATILDHADELAPEKAALVPDDGRILAETEAAFTEGESAFDVLLRVCKEKKIQMEYDDAPAYGGVYLIGINNIYQADCGDLSYWMYSVNGEFPNFGCGDYVMRDGDELCFLYTCDLGADVGSPMS